ncbi:MAG: DUF4365 domain-containing protein [Myxococcota bacterium]
MEEYSRAYLKALAVGQGYIVKSEPMPDNDSIDVWIVGKGPVRGKGYSPRLAVQLKCTAAIDPIQGPVSYDLGVKNYNDLRRTQNNTDRILVVVCVPSGWQARVRWTPEELRLARCAYWCSLMGADPTNNQATVRVKLTNVLDLDTIDDLMAHVANGSLR